MPAFPRSRFAHTPLFRDLHRALAGAGAPEAPPALPSGARSRRQFLKLAGGATALLSSEAMAAVFHEKARVAIVGAGLAGLTAAYYLRKHKIPCTVYEAASRIGGRVQTAKNVLALNTSTEFGGEFIDGDHATMFALASELGLTLVDMQAPSEAGLVERSYFVEGDYHTDEEIVAEFSGAAAQIQNDRANAGNTINYQHHTQAAVRLDEMSLAEYLEGLEMASWLRTLLTVAYTTEFGVETGQQSSLNLITRIGTDLSNNQFAPFGASDQRYQVLGGNQQIPDALAARLRSQLKLEHRLQAIRPHNAGYRLFFANSRGTDQVDADFVILCLPFSVLRGIDTHTVTMPAAKRAAIQNLGYGSNAKLMVGLSEPVWRQAGRSGRLITDQPQFAGWDNTRLQGADGAGYTFYLGGQASAAVTTGVASEIVKPYVVGANAAFPGFVLARNTGLARATWSNNPFSLGSYSTYLTGQWTSIGGAEFAPAGKLYFAGEHTSTDFPGSMEGAAATGLAAAELIRRRIKGR